MKKQRRSLIVIGILVFVPLLLLAALSLFSSRPDNLGVVDGRLAACPESPNCVSTQASNDRHLIDAIEFKGPAADAIHLIKQALSDLPRIKVVTERENYLHAEATSLVFRFVDDVEFYVDTDAGLIHFRSASRSGRSDLGVNRNRMEKFRSAFERLAD